MFSTELNDIFASATSFAGKCGSNTLNMVFLLFKILDNPSVISLLKSADITATEIQHDLLDHLEVLLRAEPDRVGVYDVRPSLFVEQLMIKCSEVDGITPVQCLDIIWKMPPSVEADYYAVTALMMRVLNAHGTLEAASILDLAAKDGDEELDLDDQVVWLEDESSPANETKVPEFCTDLVASAYAGELDPLIGRDLEVDRLIEVLGRKKKNNPILLGEPGVGKTAVVEGLAIRIASGNVPSSLKGRRIMSLDVAPFVSGTRNRGDFEERITELLKSLNEERSIILFVDEIHVFAGGISAAADAAELLKPALASGKITCIGATTQGEYKRYFEKNPALSRRFQPIYINEPTSTEAEQIIDKLIVSYGSHHKVKYEEGIASLAVELSKQYILNRFLPDKAIDIIDEAGSVAAARGMSLVTHDLITEIVSKMSGVCIAGDAVTVEQMASILSDKISGQPKVCRSLAKAIARSESGLMRNDRAKLAMLFVGPDGSGKRHAATQIASLRGQPFHSMSMVDFTERHTVSRLIGSPPGYIGYGEGGQLTEIVRRNPTCVILMERAEMAHEHVLSILKQAIETGILYDTLGAAIPFSGVTIVFTAIVDTSKGSFGFTNSSADEDEDKSDAIPGDLADIVDEVIRFDHMKDDDLIALAKQRESSLRARLLKMGITLETEGDLVSSVSEAAKGQGNNAKAVDKAFRRLAEDPVINALPKRGQTVRLDVEKQLASITVSA